MSQPTSIPCPFVYATGRVCTGHVMRIEAYKADLTWDIGPDGRAAMSIRPRSHFHIFCSEKGNHAGFRRQDADGMKFFYDQLPEALQQIVDGEG